MMNHHKQTPRMLRTSIEPNRLHHHPSRRRKSALRRLRLFENARLTPRGIKTAYDLALWRLFRPVQLVPEPATPAGGTP